MYSLRYTLINVLIEKSRKAKKGVEKKNPSFKDVIERKENGGKFFWGGELSKSKKNKIKDNSKALTNPR